MTAATFANVRQLSDTVRRADVTVGGVLFEGRRFKRMRMRREGVCAASGAPLPPGSMAYRSEDERAALAPLRVAASVWERRDPTNGN